MPPPEQAMDILPYYNELKLGGHLACAFLASIISGTAVFCALLATGDNKMFERSYAFALWSSALIWVFPMVIDASAQVRTCLAYAAVAFCVVALKYVFNKNARAAAVLWTVFLAAQAVVFFMLYKKVF